MANKTAESFTVQIKLGNAAVLTGSDLAGLLRELAEEIDSPEIPPVSTGRITELNGNTVGTWELRGEPLSRQLKIDALTEWLEIYGMVTEGHSSHDGAGCRGHREAFDRAAEKLLEEIEDNYGYER